MYRDKKRGRGRDSHIFHAVAFRSLTMRPRWDESLFLSEWFLVGNRSFLRRQRWLKRVWLIPSPQAVTRSGQFPSPGNAIIAFFPQPGLKGQYIASLIFSPYSETDFGGNPCIIWIFCRFSSGHLRAILDAKSCQPFFWFRGRMKTKVAYYAVNSLVAYRYGSIDRRDFKRFYRFLDVGSNFGEMLLCSSG